ncbi:hypothetical protein LY76DRAFT_671966 [Colletotrichum caudatum]|nr:hypothetical protein LY76DRAFT_671966 [Colletotrichum caudatum]
MPTVTRSQSSRRPSDGPPPHAGPQPTPRRRHQTSGIIVNNNNNNNNHHYKTDDHAIQLNLPLALPLPSDRQLLSLCFHASWRTHRRLRIHFTNHSKVLLDANDDDDDNNDNSSSNSDPGHRHDNLTVIDYDPIAVSSSPPPLAQRWLVPLIIESLVIAVALVLLAATAREFAELCTLARALAIPADACHDIGDLLDDAAVHLARVLAGVRTRPGPGNLISALRDTVLLMAWGIDKQHREQEGGRG